jgi:hypothetical protein
MLLNGSILTPPPANQCCCHAQPAMNVALQICCKPVTRKEVVTKNTTPHSPSKTQNLTAQRVTERGSKASNTKNDAFSVQNHSRSQLQLQQLLQHVT